MQSGFFRFSFIIFLVLMVNLVESYNFRSNRNSLSEDELSKGRSSDAPDFNTSDDYSSASPDVLDSRISVNQYQRTRRGLPPHHMRRTNHLKEGAPKVNRMSGESTVNSGKASEKWNQHTSFNFSDQKDTYYSENRQSTPIKKLRLSGLKNGSPVSHKPTSLQNYSSDSQMQQFRPKGSNERLSLIPYRGEFYSKGGKPFSIDPGLIGRWR